MLITYDLKLSQQVKLIKSSLVSSLLVFQLKLYTYPVFIQFLLFELITLMKVVTTYLTKCIHTVIE